MRRNDPRRQKRRTCSRNDNVARASWPRFPVQAAAAAGTPAIVYPSGAVCEIVDEGRTGFLVRSTEEMAKAIGRWLEIDPAACGAAATSHFSLTGMIEGYFRLYRALACGAALDRPASSSF
ncbi:MAG: glycosyltransferase [Terracidiphilus sp.]